MKLGEYLNKKTIEKIKSLNLPSNADLPNVSKKTYQTLRYEKMEKHGIDDRGFFHVGGRRGGDYLGNCAFREGNRYWRFTTELDGEQYNIYCGMLNFIAPPLENARRLLFPSAIVESQVNKRILGICYDLYEDDCGLPHFYSGNCEFTIGAEIVSDILDLITKKEIASGISERTPEHEKLYTEYYAKLAEQRKQREERKQFWLAKLAKQKEQNGGRDGSE